MPQRGFVVARARELLLKPLMFGLPLFDLGNPRLRLLLQISGAGAVGASLAGAQEACKRRQLLARVRQLLRQPLVFGLPLLDLGDLRLRVLLQVSGAGAVGAGLAPTQETFQRWQLLTRVRQLLGQSLVFGLPLLDLGDALALAAASQRCRRRAYWPCRRARKLSPAPAASARARQLLRQPLVFGLTLLDLDDAGSRLLFELRRANDALAAGILELLQQAKILTRARQLLS